MSQKTSFYEITKLIEKKRNGEALSSEEISRWVEYVVFCGKEDSRGASCRDGFLQIGAMLMAMAWRGLSAEETLALTRSMADDAWRWPSDWRLVDKHSTGGVGDKVSLVLAPALAALGFKVPMMSGRSLAHTGGTLDKLESVPGFRVSLTHCEIQAAMKKVGCCIVAQSPQCCPADRVLYAARDTTATVMVPQLIVASIASKKLSEGLNALIYDVKFGKGSIFKTKEDALETAKKLVEVSRDAGATALLTSMEAPLGRAIGNSLELLEAVNCMRQPSKSPPDFLQLLTALGGEILRKERGLAPETAREALLESLKNGSALAKFSAMLREQGVQEDTAKALCNGDAEKVMQGTKYVTNVAYDGKDGIISSIDPLILAKLWKDELKECQSHAGVGFILEKTVGDFIKTGEIWLKFHHETNQNLTSSQKKEISNTIHVDLRNGERNLIDKRIYFLKDQLMIENY